MEHIQYTPLSVFRGSIYVVRLEYDAVANERLDSALCISWNFADRHICKICAFKIKSLFTHTHAMLYHAMPWLRYLYSSVHGTLSDIIFHFGDIEMFHQKFWASAECLRWLYGQRFLCYCCLCLFPHIIHMCRLRLTEYEHGLDRSYIITGLVVVEVKRRIICWWCKNRRTDKSFLFINSRVLNNLCFSLSLLLSLLWIIFSFGKCAWELPV